MEFALFSMNQQAQYTEDEEKKECVINIRFAKWETRLKTKQE